MSSSIPENSIGIPDEADLSAPLLNDKSKDDEGKKIDPQGVRDEAPRVLNVAHDIFHEQRESSSASFLRQGIESIKRKGCKLFHVMTSRPRATAQIVNRIADLEESSQEKQITQKSSLSSSSTHAALKIIIPLLIIINHILFYHAQTKAMWNLTYNIDVAVTATASTLKSKSAFDVLNLPHHYEFIKKENQVVETFTYMDAIQKLWKGEGLGHAQTISKLSAALLVMFSGIWPHLKLVLLHLCWFFPFRHTLRNHELDENDEFCEKTSITCCTNRRYHKSYTTRSSFLRALSIFGKWSLADVLVVCVLIAVLHLDWNLNVDGIRSGVEEKLPTILSFVQNKYPDEVDDCKQLLDFECAMGRALVIHYPACLACETLIKNAYHHPEWSVGEGKDILNGITLEGGGYAELRVIGMIGTYFFCGAVIMSIFLSFVVGAVDEGDRTRIDEELLTRGKEINQLNNDLRLTPHSPSQQSLNQSGMQTLNDVGSPLATVTSISNSNYIPKPIPTPTTNSRLLKYTMVIILSLISIPLTSFAVSLPTMERVVIGGIPTLLREVLGMVWVQEYSLTSLVATTGDAGGWDTFLMITFGMFIVVGPIARSVALTLHMLIGLPIALLGECIEQPRRRTSLRMFLYQLTSTIQKTLRPFIDASGAFCSWEVLIIALLMIQAEIPSITDTIYEDDRCMDADPEDGRTCIEVQFNIMDSFLLVAIAWLVLVVASAFLMELTANDDENNKSIYKSKTRYAYGMTIPHRTRANMSSDQSWKGALRDIDISEINSAMGEQLTTSSPLLQIEPAIQERGSLEEIIFV